MIVFYLLLSVAIIVLLTTKLNVHPFIALIAAALAFAFLAGLSFDTIVQSINDGFGSTMGKIGMIIVLGILIGTFLERSGAAFKLAEVVLRVIGKKRVHEAMGIIGFIISVPVFADSAFIILSPLNKSLTKKAGLSLAGTGIALALGLTITHVLVPPTPGPIAAAGILDADIGLVMFLGIAIGLVALVVAIIFAKKYAAKTYIDPNPDYSDEQIEDMVNQAPSAFKSFLPILIPILLILAKSLVDFNFDKEATALWIETIRFMGSPVIALLIGVLLAFLLPKKLDKEVLSTTGWIGKAIGDASSILLITGAGGIFGTMLQVSGIGTTMAEMLSGANLGIWLPFILCAAIKTAQGSSTVALITTASIIAPILQSLGFETEMQKALVVIAIGAGAAVVPHVNDSGFWVFSQLIGMDIKTGYRLITFGAFIVGTFTGLVVFVLSMFI